MSEKVCKNSCYSCGSNTVELFYEVPGVPTNSVLLLDSRRQALDFPLGDIKLGFCLTCGHVFNTAFDPQLTEYSGRYESTQGFSPTFNRFNRQLARDLIDRFDLRQKSIIEIGCGHGEFLTLLCEMGGNRGLGFDPAYQSGRIAAAPGTHINFIADFYSQSYTDHAADFFVCKMTLEHILETHSFVHMIRQAVGQQLDSTVFFQIPNGRYVFGDRAFWDVYYEHCSYFTAGSLAGLFRKAHFEVLDCWTGYQDQYLMIAARPTAGPTSATLPLESDLTAFTAEINSFRDKIPGQIQGWRQLVKETAAAGKKVVLWGGGSKGVSFLTTTGITSEIQYVVDINPHKAHTFMAGTGQEIVPPSFLQSYRPDLVIVMNPVYIPEITREVHDLGIYPEILGLG